MLSPITYSEWSHLLDRFGEGDDTALVELSKVSFSVDAGTAVRFYSIINEAYKKRKQSWLDRFQRSFQLNTFKTEDDFEIILRNGKLSLCTLSKYVNLEGLPDDLKKNLIEDFEYFVDQIKGSLKDSISKNSRGKEKILILLGTFSFNNFHRGINSEIKVLDKDKHDTIPPVGRKIIF